MKYDIRLNDLARRNLKRIEECLLESGFDQDEARSLARTYYSSMCHKQERLKLLEEDED